MAVAGEEEEKEEEEEEEEEEEVVEILDNTAQEIMPDTHTRHTRNMYSFPASLSLSSQSLLTTPVAPLSGRQLRFLGPQDSVR